MQWCYCGFLDHVSDRVHISGFVSYRFAEAFVCSESGFLLHKFVISLYDDFKPEV